MGHLFYYVSHLYKSITHLVIKPLVWPTYSRGALAMDRMAALGIFAKVLFVEHLSPCGACLVRHEHISLVRRA